MPKRIRAYVKRSREETLRTWLKHYYRLTPQLYGTLKQQQKGLCALCDKVPAKWCVDHDHTCCPGRRVCGKCIRGLLCDNCNRALGSCEKIGLSRIINYLERN